MHAHEATAACLASIGPTHKYVCVVNAGLKVSMWACRSIWACNWPVRKGTLQNLVASCRWL
eukprot:366039-Chlamydomonas_euryale.AAC.19